MSSTTVTPSRQDPAPDLRTFARTALLVEPLTGGAVWAVLWSSTYLGGLQAAVLATAAALVVAAVAGSSIRVRRRVGGARVAVLVAILLALGGAGVLTASDSLDTPVLPVLTVLCAGPAAWVVLWSDRPATGALRLLIAAALVVPLGFVAFAVGVYATPYVLLTALAVWLAFRTLPRNGAPAEAPAVVGRRRSPPSGRSRWRGPRPRGRRCCPWRRSPPRWSPSCSSRSCPTGCPSLTWLSPR